MGGALCIRCKCCEAQIGFVLCVFCEDNVPCPGAKKRATTHTSDGTLVTPPPAAAKTKALPPSAAEKKQKELGPQPETAATKPGADARTGNLQIKRPKGQSEELKHKVRPQRQDSPKGEQPTMGNNDHPRNAKGERVCVCGCGTVLRSRHPYIKGHNKASEPKFSPPRKTAAKPASNAAITAARVAVANICVPESALDAFWQKLSIEEKAELFVRQLEQGA